MREHPNDDEPLSRSGQKTLTATAGALSIGFLLATYLTPDPRGLGTHEQLGLPPCTFKTWTGIPCPSCGCTTCFALFVRGRWSEAAQLHPVCFVLAVVCAILIPWCGISRRCKRYWLVKQPSKALRTLVWSISLLALLQWLYRIARQHI